MKVRVAASVALAAVVATGMSACMLITPQQTAASYTPSDGVNGHVGDVSIRNAMLVVNADGSAGTLVGAFVNTGDSAATLSLQYETVSGSVAEQQVRVPADDLISLGAPADLGGDATVGNVVLQDIDAPLGALFPVSVSVGSSSGQLQLPIQTGSLSEYATLIPTPSPTPTRTRRSTPEPTESALLESPGPAESLSTETPTPTPTP